MVAVVYGNESGGADGEGAPSCAVVAVAVAREEMARSRGNVICFDIRASILLRGGVVSYAGGPAGGSQPQVGRWLRAP